MIKAIIVEDEHYCSALLCDMLSELAPDIKVLATAESVQQSVDLIRQLQPELVFLDIHLKDSSGFDVLAALPDLKFEVIFTTAFNQYALQAFEVAALHYLLKPISENDLVKAIDRYRRQHQDKSVVQQARQEQLLNSSPPHRIEKIGLPTTNNVVFVAVADILYIEANTSYSFFYFKAQTRIVTSKPLRIYEQMLTDTGFYRIHDKYLVNLAQVTRYVKGRGGQAELSNGTLLDVSVRRKDGFLGALSQFNAK